MYRTVDTATWGDPWFEELSPPAKLLFLYLITNSRTNSCGAYPITMRTMSNEICLPVERIPALLAELEERVEWFEEERFVFVLNFYRHQRANSSEKFRVGAQKQTGDLPDAVRDRVWEVYPELDTQAIPYHSPTDTLSDTLPDTLSGGVSAKQNSNRDISETETKNPPTPQRGTGRRGTRIPDDFALTEAMVEYAAAKGVPRNQAASMTEEFVLYWQSTTKNPTAVDWVKRWQGRLLEQIGQGRIGPNARAPNGYHGANGNLSVDRAPTAIRTDLKVRYRSDE
jgi:hypothetical protein